MSTNEEIFAHPHFRRQLQKREHRPARAAFILRDNGCIEWQGAPTSKGYGYDGRALQHRAAWEAIVGPIETGHQLHHECGNKLCCNPAHLQSLTAEEHWQLEARKKIDFETLFRIVHAMAMGVSDEKIAMMFGVGRYYARDIRRGHRRKHDVAKIGIPLTKRVREWEGERGEAESRAVALVAESPSVVPLMAPKIPADATLTPKRYRLQLPSTSKPVENPLPRGGHGADDREVA